MPIKETQWTVLMQIIREHPYDIDCVMIHEMLQARTSEKNSETATHAARVVEERMTRLQNRRDGEDKQQQMIESSQKQESEARLGNWLQRDGAEVTVFFSPLDRKLPLFATFGMLFLGEASSLCCTFLHRASSLFRFSHSVQIHLLD